jgi:hypothetical protein
MSRLKNAGENHNMTVDKSSENVEKFADLEKI